MSYTVTSKGTVTIPAEIRKKYGLKKGGRVRYVETEHGILMVPVTPIEDLFGVDREAKEEVYKMIKELQEERRREAHER